MRRRGNTVELSRPHGKSVAGSLLLLSIMFYIGFHAVSGERGVFALFKETRRLEELQAELGRVQAKRQALDHKVHLLGDDSLDLDLLDEQVRRVLGLANKGEVVYFSEGEDKANRPLATSGAPF